MKTTTRRLAGLKSALCIGLLLGTPAAAAQGGFVCGDSFVGPNESCDDGNTVDGDGCSSVCLIENNFECSGSFVPTANNTVTDPGFEFDGEGWEIDTTSSSPVICTVERCPNGFFSRRGARWAQLDSPQGRFQTRLRQDVEIPESHRFIQFDVAFPLCGSSADRLSVLVDGQLLLQLNGADEDCGGRAYRTEQIDLVGSGGGFNDGGVHVLDFEAETFFVQEQASVFLIDNVQVVQPVGPPQPSECELAPRTLSYQDFDPGVAGQLDELGYTTFELLDPVPWGTTDDGVCGTGQVPLGNVTGGAGEAACLDATAGGGGDILSLLCTEGIDFEFARDIELSFLLNLQLGQGTSGDFLAIIAGNVPPDPDSINDYVLIESIEQNVGEFGFPPGELIDLDLNILQGEPQGFVCFAFGAETAFYAQIDEIDIDAGSCVDDDDEDKLLGCFDNCTERFNPDQTDSDGDGYGNACDADINRESTVSRVPSGNGNDCAVNFADLGVLRAAFFTNPTDENWNPDADLNNDQVVNVLDLGLMRQFFFNPPGPSSLTSRCNAPRP
ncbi:MAG: DUF4215 domain-containing protein [Pseudomonadota bacterium]